MSLDVLKQQSYQGILPGSLFTIVTENRYQSPTSAQIGRGSELVFETYCNSNGWIISRPSEPNAAKYDYIVDNGNELWKIQVKTLRIRNNGAYELKLRATQRDNKDHIYTAKDIDYIVGVCPITQELYWMDARDIDERTSVTFHV